MRSTVSRLTVPVEEDDHVRGPADAPVTLVEYGDFECPFCRAVFPVVEGLRERFGGRLRVVFRHFPMTSVHPNARRAARAVEAAALQDSLAFWAMHDRLYQRQGSLDEETLLAVAQSIGLDVGRFRTDMTSEAVEAAVQSDFIGGARSGVNGTPTFYINGVRYDGPHTSAMLGAAIEQSLLSD